jgi:hypothetical protein
MNKKRNSVMKCKFLVLVVIMAAFSKSVLAQSSSLVRHVWGVATNGLSGGICVEPSDQPSHKGDFYCDIDVRNMTTNSLSILVPRLDQRYEIELRGPDGRRIAQLKPFLPNPKWGSDWSHWLGREPYNSDPLSERGCLSWFFLKETFDVKTNGLHTLIVSVRVNAFTNFAIGREEMRKNTSYFLLPPVTNTFNVLPSWAEEEPFWFGHPVRYFVVATNGLRLGIVYPRSSTASVGENPLLIFRLPEKYIPKGIAPSGKPLRDTGTLYEPKQEYFIRFTMYDPASNTVAKTKLALTYQRKDIPSWDYKYMLPYNDHSLPLPIFVSEAWGSFYVKLPSASELFELKRAGDYRLIVESQVFAWIGTNKNVVRFPPLEIPLKIEFDAPIKAPAAPKK